MQSGVPEGGKRVIVDVDVGEDTKICAIAAACAALPFFMSASRCAVLLVSRGSW
jgi:hypothetical protein